MTPSLPPHIDRSRAAVELLPVDDLPTRDAARRLITEYLQWIARSAADHYGLTFDVAAMVASDLDDRTKFYPPNGRFYVVRHAGEYVGVGCLKRLAPDVERPALRKLEQLDWSSVLADMRVPPGDQLEALKGARKGQHSIRINDQWRVCFVWTTEGAKDVEIVDYH